MTTGKVDVPLEWETISKSEDPVGAIRQAAIAEIELRYGYEKHEIDTVNRDGAGTLEHSCKRAYLWMRGKHDSQRKAEYKARKKGDASPAMPPLAWKIAIAYERPETRGFMEREVAPSS